MNSATSESSPRDNRVPVLVSLVVAYLVNVALLFRLIQLRVWNNMGAFDLLAMAIMILPFMIVPWLDRSRPLKRVTRWAWILSAVMALDLVFFTSGTLGPFGSGHPSLEALGSSFLGIAKPVLVPVTLVLLGIACIKGERMLVVSLGFLCLAAETLYAVYPMTG